MKSSLIFHPKFYFALLFAFFLFAAFTYQNCAPANFEFESKSANKAGTDSGETTGGTTTGGTTTGGTTTGGTTTGGTTTGGNTCMPPRTMVGQQCVCPGVSNYKPSTNECLSCTSAEVWDPMTFACVARCPAGQHWNGMSCVTCAAGTTWDGRACVPITAQCDSYIELNPPADQAFVVPARTTAKICYYIKLVNRLTNRDSQQVTQMRQDIVARNHDGETPHPRIMGERTLLFSLAGERQVMVASDTAGTTRIRVDNFLLFEVTRAAGLALWASGSADAPPTNGPITVGGVPVTNYLENAPTGVDNYVPAHDLRPYINLSDTTVLRASALDCGGVAETSDIYLLFK